MNLLPIRIQSMTIVNVDVRLGEVLLSMCLNEVPYPKSNFCLKRFSLYFSVLNITIFVPEIWFEE